MAQSYSMKTCATQMHDFNTEIDHHFLWQGPHHRNRMREDFNLLNINRHDVPLQELMTDRIFFSPFLPRLLIKQL